MADVSNILFDFGNVIIDIDIPGARERLLSLKRDNVDSRDFESDAQRAIELFEVGKITPEAFVDRLMAYTRPEIDTLQVIDAWNSMLIAIPPFRLGMLEQLKARYNTYLLSNTNILHIDWVHQYLVTHAIVDFESTYFHSVYYSHQIGHRKPDPGAFQYIIDDTYLSPAKTLFIDDMPENIDTARSLGFQTLLSPTDEEIAETLKLMRFY